MDWGGGGGENSTNKRGDEVKEEVEEAEC
jgi:hypothetical protein